MTLQWYESHMHSVETGKASLGRLGVFNAFSFFHHQLHFFTLLGCNSIMSQGSVCKEIYYKELAHLIVEPELLSASGDSGEPVV